MTEISTNVLQEQSEISTKYDVLQEGYKLHLEGKGFTKNSIRSYLSNVRQFTSFLTVDPELVTDRDLLRFIHNELSNDANNTIVRKIVVIRSFFNWMKDVKGLISHFPFEHIIAPKREVTPRKIVDEEHVRKALRSLDDGTEFKLRDKCIASLILYHGFRLSDLVKFKIHHFGGARPHWERGTDELGVVALGSELVSDMLKYLNLRMSNVIENQPQAHDFLFVNKDGKSISERSVRRRLSLVELSPNLLRHSFALTALKNGTDAKTLQKQMGHKSTGAVRRYLASLT